MKRSFTSIATIALSTLLSFTSRTEAQQRVSERGLKVGARSTEVSDGQDIQRWAIVIGISNYKNGDKTIRGVTVPNLLNAADDAQKFYNFLRSPEGGDFRDVKEGGHLILLKDEQATKANVEQAINGL